MDQQEQQAEERGEQLGAPDDRRDRLRVDRMHREDQRCRQGGPLGESDPLRE